MEAYQRESFSPSFTSYSIWIAIVYSHKKTSWNWCMSFLSWWCPWTLESVWVPFCGTQLLYEVHVEGVPWIIWWPTKYTFILVYMSLDGHGSIAKRIVFSLFYLRQYLNSNCVFSQKNNSWNQCMSLLSWSCPWTLWMSFLWDSVTVWGRGSALNDLMTQLIYLYSCLHGLDGHGGISKGIVFSLFYLLQYLNSNCVFPQKDILKLMHERFELVMPLDPLLKLMHEHFELVIPLDPHYLF